MAILITSNKKYFDGLTVTLTYWPEVDGDLQRYVDSPDFEVVETVDGEIEKTLLEQKMKVL